jgi:hypothetical protein
MGFRFVVHGCKRPDLHPPAREQCGSGCGSRSRRLINAEGNVWTTDAASSVVYNFTRAGKLLLKIQVGQVAERSRALEQRGKRVRTWRSGATAAGQFYFPHVIAVDGRGVADHARIQCLTLDGRFRGEGSHLGETFFVDGDSGVEPWIDLNGSGEPLTSARPNRSSRFPPVKQ